MAIVYVVVLTYIRPLEEVDAALSDHIEWLKRGYHDGVFIASGRRVPRNGGVILARSESVAELEARLADDPFQRLGLAKVDIYPFEPTMAAEGVVATTFGLPDRVP